MFIMQAHEVGHNLGLMHSNEGGIAYGDQSGLSKFLNDRIPSPIDSVAHVLSKSGIQLCG
jgi:hypothetical protein